MDLLEYTPEGRARLARLFATSLALAGASACSQEPRSPDGSVDQSPLEARLLPTPELLAHAAEFQALRALGEGLKEGVELVAIVQRGELEVVCTPGPCKPAWVEDTEIFTLAAVVREGGSEKLLLRDQVIRLLEPIDSAGEAALIARLHGATLATCLDFEKQGLACAPGSALDAIAVRAAGGRFDVGTVGRQDICPSPERADREVSGLASLAVGADGVVDSEAGVLLSALRAAAPQVHCYHPRRGRMPEGYVDPPLERSALEYAVRAQHQEALAAIAFDRLARELEAHAAPQDLVSAARTAADEERSHAAVFAAWARDLNAAGQEPARNPPQPEGPHLRPLWDVLQENAIEGCVHESYAAVVATHQALHAPTPRLREALASIASDEQGHAALAHRIHRWGRSVLPADQAALLETTRVRAHQALCRGAGVSEPALALGEPAPQLAVRAYRQVSEALTRA